jgi:hypothetical protein
MVAGEVSCLTEVAVGKWGGCWPWPGAEWEGRWPWPAVSSPLSRPSTIFSSSVTTVRFHSLWSSVSNQIINVMSMPNLWKILFKNILLRYLLCHAYPSFHTHIRFVCTLKLYSLILWESKTTNLPIRTYIGSKLHKILKKLLLQNFRTYLLANLSLQFILSQNNAQTYPGYYNFYIWFQSWTFSWAWAAVNADNLIRGARNRFQEPSLELISQAT